MSRFVPGPSRWTVLLLVLAMTAAGGTGAGEPLDREGSVTALPIGRFHRGTITCDEAGCARHTYRLEIAEPGQLRIEVYVPSGPTDVGLTLQSGDRVVASSSAAVERPRRILVPVRAGTFHTEVFVVGARQTVTYDVHARLEAGGAGEAAEGPLEDVIDLLRAEARPVAPPPPPPPVSAPRLSRQGGLEVVEVELENGEPAFVLLDLRGRTRVGQRGRLVEGEDRIGEVEVVEVLERGCRARVVGELRGVITTRTLVQLRR